MIIDCHGHFTTAPKALLEWRRNQLEATDTTYGQPLQISDDELREALEGRQLQEQRTRGLDGASPGHAREERGVVGHCQ